MTSTISTLKIARLSAGIRLQDAARHIGVPDTILSKFERFERRITVGQVERLATLYECESDMLRGRKPFDITAKPPIMGF